MKRAALALLALGLLFGAANPVSAWSNFNIGTGINVGYQGGGNNVLFGLLSGAPGPGCNYGYPAGPGYGQAPDFDGYGVAVGYPLQSPIPQPPPQQQQQQAPATPAQQQVNPNAHFQAGYYEVKVPDYWGR